MLSRRFDDLLDDLLMASAAYHGIPRNPETVPHLAQARWYLEAVRTDIAAERELVLARRHGTAPSPRLTDNT